MEKINEIKRERERDAEQKMKHSATVIMTTEKRTGFEREKLLLIVRSFGALYAFMCVCVYLLVFVSPTVYLCVYVCVCD